jgi:hypothetical protein
VSVKLSVSIAAIVVVCEHVLVVCEHVLVVCEHVLVVCEYVLVVNSASITVIVVSELLTIS